jgi:hypothetical protein
MLGVGRAPGLPVSNVPEEASTIGHQSVPDPGPPEPTALATAREFLRERQAEWARGLPIEPSDNVLDDALLMAGNREAGSVRDGRYIRAGAFKYEAAQEEARWAMTREILRRVSPGPHEDPRYLEMLAREAASVEYILAGDRTASDRSGVPAEILSRILIGTTGAPWSEGYSASIAGMAIIIVSAGMMSLMYQTSKAVVLAWKQKTPPKNRTVAFSTSREDTEDVLKHDPYPVELFHDTLVTWLYEGFPRASHSRAPAQPYQWPLTLLISGAERFVMAHEYGHALIDQLNVTTRDGQTLGFPPAPTSWDRELRADAVAIAAVVQSSRELDQLPSNMALQGAIVAMKVHQVLGQALAIATRGVAGPDVGSASHPPLERRIAQVQQTYLQHLADTERVRDSIRGMLVPSQTIEQLWERVAPRLTAYYRARRVLHPIWSRVGR